MRQQRRHVTAIVIVLVLSGVIAAHHSGVGMAMHDGSGGMAAVAQMCLAVFTAVGAALVAVRRTVLALGRWRPALTLCPSTPLAASPVPVARARHGPLAMSFLCVSRR